MTIAPANAWPRSLARRRVARELDLLIAVRGKPKSSSAIAPGKPVQNAFIESFYGLSDSLSLTMGVTINGMVRPGSPVHSVEA